MDFPYKNDEAAASSQLMIEMIDELISITKNVYVLLAYRAEIAAGSRLG